LDEKTWALCRQFNIEDKLDLRPADLDPTELRAAITIRELTKSPTLLLLEQPEWFVGQRRFGPFTETMGQLIGPSCSIVLSTSDEAFAARFSNRTIRISGGEVSTADFFAPPKGPPEGTL
jgi:ABC-type lipoprotein export system ATPase subunit